MDIDGRSIIEAAILAGTKDPKVRKLFLIGRKYGLSAQDTLAFLTEVTAVYQTDQDK